MRQPEKHTKHRPVRGVVAPTVRPTPYAAFLVAVGLSVPVFILLSAVELIFLR